jgi:patatin-like phospholipase/acyl hydrolase
LSGAIHDDATDAQRASILAFVRQFAAAVFERGGYIVHGAHPHFTQALLDAAEKYHKANAGAERKDCLTLAISKLWSKFPDEADKCVAYRRYCKVYEEPEVGDEKQSLENLRRWTADNCDAFVAIAGRHWDTRGELSGVPIEFSIAQSRNLPAFLLGGFGGAVKGLVEKRADAALAGLRNGLSLETNRQVASGENVDELVEAVASQLARLPLIKGRVSEGSSFRILALDGGGVKGAFTASVLATLEDAIGEPIARHFDLVSGTSTGGILAVGLGMGRTPGQMLKFYRERGAEIFPVGGWVKTLWQGFRQLFVGPKYSQDPLRKAIQDAYFPDGAPTRALGDSLCRLVVPAYDAVSGRCHVFRTPIAELNLQADRNTSAVEVALATAAAPTYFQGATVETNIANGLYLDGGVWANCPTMAAIAEAVGYLDVPLDRIDILSIGTTAESFTVKDFSSSGVAGWNVALISLFSNAQVDATLEQTGQLLGEDRFLRIDAQASPGEYALDKAQGVEHLIALGNKTANNPTLLRKVKSRFLNGIPARNWKA